MLGIISLLMITDMVYEGSALVIFGEYHPGAGWLPVACHEYWRWLKPVDHSMQHIDQRRSGGR